MPQNSDVQYIYYVQKNGATFVKAKCIKGDFIINKQELSEKYKDNPEFQASIDILAQFMNQLSQEDKEALIVSRTSDKTSKAIRGLLSKINRING